MRGAGCEAHGECYMRSRWLQGEQIAKKPPTPPSCLRVVHPRTWPAMQRLAWRVPENLLIALVGGATLMHPRVPLFLKTYSAGAECTPLPQSF